MLRRHRCGSVRQRRPPQRDAAEHPGGEPTRSAREHRQEPGAFLVASIEICIILGKQTLEQRKKRLGLGVCENFPGIERNI